VCGLSGLDSDGFFPPWEQASSRILASLLSVNRTKKTLPPRPVYTSIFLCVGHMASERAYGLGTGSLYIGRVYDLLSTSNVRKPLHILYLVQAEQHCKKASFGSSFLMFGQTLRDAGVADFHDTAGAFHRI